MHPPLLFDVPRYAALESPSDRELFIFKWLSSLDAYLEEAPVTKEDLKKDATQERLEHILLEIATIPLPTTPATTSSSGKQRLGWLTNTETTAGRQTTLLNVPKPSRVVRDLVAKCLARVYELGDIHRMGEALYAIQTAMHAKRRAVERETRLAALTCAGVLFEALASKAGFRLLSCFNDFLALMLRFARTADESVAVRVEATRALAKLLQGGGGKTATDAQAKDIVKTLRPNLQHRSPLLVMATATALEALVFFTPFLRPTQEQMGFDADAFVSTTLVPLLSTSVLVVRRALARLTAVLISHSITLSSSAVAAVDLLDSRSAANPTTSGLAAPRAVDPAARAISRTQALQSQQQRPASAAAAISTLGPAATMRGSLEVGAANTNSAAAAHSESARRDTVSLARGSDAAESATQVPRLSSDHSAQAPLPLPLSASAAAPLATSIDEGSGGGRGVSLGRALMWLGQPFTRATASRELRAGIIDAYAALFAELGAAVVEAHYPLILAHILGVLASSTQIAASSAVDSRTKAPRAGLTHAIGTPSNLPTSYFAGGSGGDHPLPQVVGLIGSMDARAEAEVLALRNMCAWLLRVPLAQALLSDVGKRAAAQCIWDRWLKGPMPAEVRAVVAGNVGGGGSRAALAAFMPWRAGGASSAQYSGGAGNGETALLVALHEWRMLVNDLDESSQSLDVFMPAPSDNSEGEMWVVPLENWLADTNEAVRISAAAGLAALIRHDSTRLARVLSTLISRFQQFCAHCSTTSDSSLAAMRRTIGYAYAIAGVIGVAAREDSSGGAAAAAAGEELMLSVPLDLLDWVHIIAIRLLNAAYQRAETEMVNGNDRIPAVDGADPGDIGTALGVTTAAASRHKRRETATTREARAAAADYALALANMRMSAGWILLAGLTNTALGAGFFAGRVQAAWMPLWMAALPLPDSSSSSSGSSSSGFVTGDMPWALRAHLLQSRTMALTHVLCVLRAWREGEASAAAAAAAAELQLRDGDLRHVVACLKATLVFADNALDAPPPPLLKKQSSGGNALDVVDPARPVWQLPTQTSLLTSHVEVRCRVAECLQTFGARADLISGMTLPTVRLIEQAIGSVDNLYEIMGSRIGAAVMAAVLAAPCATSPALSAASLGTAAASGGSSAPGGHAEAGAAAAAASGAGAGAGAPTCLRGFRSGPWGYELETGTTTLLHAIVREGGDVTSAVAGAAIGDGADFGGGCSMRAAEFDWLQTLFEAGLPAAPHARLVDAAVRLFGVLFPTLAENAQLTVLDGLVLQLNGLPFNSHRYVAVLTNILAALYAAVQGCAQARRGEGAQQTRTPAEVAPRVARAMAETTRAALILPSAAHRLLAGEVVGRLAALARDAATAYLPPVLDHLSSQAIRSRDRFARAGAAVALGALYAHGGALVAAGTLRRVVALLHSLASDKDPVVHTWAIGALAEAAMSAGFMFAPYARDSFQMALKLVLSDSHALPLHASALWIRGREHAPPPAALDCAGAHERVLPLRTATDLQAWGRRADGGAAHEGAAERVGAQDAFLGHITALGRDAATTHPNSTTHHGRASDEQRDAAAAAAALAAASDGDFQFVCARVDADAFDARAALGHLVNALVQVAGPELQAGGSAARDSALTLLRELRRALPSAGVPVPPAMRLQAELALVVDPDARWQTAAQHVFATQKQLLFFAPPNDAAFLPLRVVRQTLRPILRARQAGLHALQAVAAQALEGVLRLYGSRVIDNGAAARSDWALCDVVWEALALHSAAGSAGTQQHLLLAAELRRLVHTTASLACAHEYAQLERLGAGSADETAAPETVGVVGALCAVFTKRATAALPRGIRRRGTRCDGAEGELAKEEEEEEEGEEDPSGVLGADGARAFTAAAKQLAVAALVAVLDCVDRLRPARSATAAAVWRAHPLAAALGDLVRVGYMAATAPAEQSARLCCLGQLLLQHVIAQFSDVEDPAMRGEGVCVLGIYQAQLSAAFMPVLAGFAAGGSDTQQMPPPLVALAATNTAAAVVVSGLVGGDRPTLLRILRLLAPATASFSSRLSSGTHSYSAQMLVVLRLNLLHAWAAIFDYAAAGSFHSCRPPASRLLLEALELHMPLLAGLWLDAIRDTAVAGLQPRDVYAELACLLGDQQTDNDNGFDPSLAGGDLGLGLRLGLDSAYVGLVHVPLAAWYRHCLPRFLRAVSKLMLNPARVVSSSQSSDCGSGAATVGRVLDIGTNALVSRLQNTAESAADVLLLLGFALQELTRLASLSSMRKYVALENSSSSSGKRSVSGGGFSDLFVAAAAEHLVGALDVGGAPGNNYNDLEAERIACLERAGIRVYGPAQPPGESSAGAIAVQWAADVELVASLLSTLRALLEMPDTSALSALFATTTPLLLSASTANNGECRKSWLVEAVWTQAVTNVVAPLVEPFESAGGANKAVVDQQQQRSNRSVRVGLARKALAVARALLGGRLSEPDSSERELLDQWLFVDSCSGGAFAGGDEDVLKLLAPSPFGRTVIRDIVATWRFARSVLLDERSSGPGDLVGNDNVEESLLFIGLACDCLGVLAVIISRRIGRCGDDGRQHSRAPLIAFWLGLWRELVVVLGNACPDVAATALVDFVRLVEAAAKSPVVGDILTDDADSLVLDMVNALLVQMLLQSSDPTTAVKDKSSANSPGVLGTISRLLGSQTQQKVNVSTAVQMHFVAAYTACLNSSCGGPALSGLLDVPVFLAQCSGLAIIMPALARASIPVLAKLAFSQLVEEVEVEEEEEEEKALAALAAFATAKYADDMQAGLVLAAVLMLLLSMLPDEPQQMTGRRQVRLAETILSLATAKPDTFRTILLKLSATQPIAKRRLELAIRSRSAPSNTSARMQSDDDDEYEDDGNNADHSFAAKGTARTTTRIALKSDFGV